MKSLFTVLSTLVLMSTVAKAAGSLDQQIVCKNRRVRVLFCALDSRQVNKRAKALIVVTRKGQDFEDSEVTGSEPYDEENRGQLEFMTKDGLLINVPLHAMNQLELRTTTQSPRALQQLEPQVLTNCTEAKEECSDRINNFGE